MKDVMYAKILWGRYGDLPKVLEISDKRDGSMILPIPVVDFGLQVYIFSLKVMFAQSENWYIGFRTYEYKGLDC
jgi:hypothetical protein